MTTVIVYALATFTVGVIFLFIWTNSKDPD